MPAPDLQGPYDDFVERLADIRRIVCAIESCYRAPGTLTSSRPNSDLAAVGPTTSNNTNSMALVFLASSFEEFVREELCQCAGLLRGKYPSLQESVRHTIRSSYWSTTLQCLGNVKNILAKSNPKTVDAAVIARIRPVLDVAQLFVVGDNSSQIDAETAVYHRNNFRPKVVDEISGRIGIPNLINRTAEGARVKTYFGVSTAPAAAKLLHPRLDEFYDRRNEIVHSLSSSTGYGVDYVLDWLSLFDIVADSMMDALSRAISTW